MEPLGPGLTWYAVSNSSKSPSDPEREVPRDLLGVRVMTVLSPDGEGSNHL